jgi:hypothetical protein
MTERQGSLSRFEDSRLVRLTSISPFDPAATPYDDSHSAFQIGGRTEGLGTFEVTGQSSVTG